MTQIFEPTRAAGLSRLNEFIPLAGKDYAQHRNFDLGAGNHRHVSTLSPYLRVRLLTEPEVVQSVLGRHSFAASEKFVQEVFWRTYWKGWLEMRPAIWTQYQNDLNRSFDAVQTQAGLRQKWEAACTGATDIECFNIWSQELVNTGYLHNHARMWFASIWIFTLQLPWTLGADFFMRHLLDGDPASNTLGWRWVAGIQTRGKTYLARTSNISKFTQGRFHPKWQLAGDASPIDAAESPAASSIPEVTPQMSGLRTGFLLHEEDLSPDFAWKKSDAMAIATLQAQTKVGPLMQAPQVAAFRNSAIQDTANRWVDRAGTAAETASAQDILEWAEKEQLEQIVTPYAPVGPVAKTIAAVRATKHSPRVCQIIRPYDAMTWPHATKGYFPFKKQLPDFLSKL